MKNLTGVSRRIAHATSLALTLALTLILASSAAAQNRPGRGGPAAGGTPPAAGPLRERARERIKAMRAARLIELLALDEAAAARVFPVFRKYDAQLDALRVQDMNITKQIRILVAASAPDGKALSALVDKILANRERRHQLQNQQIAELRRVLTPVQAAKLVFVLPEIEHELRAAIRRAVKGRPGLLDLGPSPGMRPGPGPGMGPGPRPGPRAPDGDDGVDIVD